MIIKLLTSLFNILIGKLPDDKKEELKNAFGELIKQAVAGAVQGAIKR